MRLPKDLHARVRRAAEAAGHTMNAEIIARVAKGESNVTMEVLARQNEEILKRLRDMAEAIDLLKK